MARHLSAGAAQNLSRAGHLQHRHGHGISSRRNAPPPPPVPYRHITTNQPIPKKRRTPNHIHYNTNRDTEYPLRGELYYAWDETGKGKLRAPYYDQTKEGGYDIYMKPGLLRLLFLGVATGIASQKNKNKNNQDLESRRTEPATHNTPTTTNNRLG